MPITVQQAWQNVDLSLENGSGENSDSRATVYYIVSGTTSDADACLEAWAHSDEIFHAMPRKSVSVNERLTDDTWKIEVIYGNDISNSSNSDVEGEPKPVPTPILPGWMSAPRRCAKPTQNKCAPPTSQRRTDGQLRT